MKKKKIYTAGFIFLLILCSCEKTDNTLKYFQLHEVELLESPFKNAQEVNKEYLLSLNPDRLLAPFLREAGLETKQESYTNWENTGLDGHIGGHYLSALSYMYASTGDSQIGERLTYMIDQLKKVQDSNRNGYIGGVPNGKDIWEQIAAGNIQAAHFNLNGKWVPLYNIHKMYAGLRDAWLHTGNTTAQEMLIQMTDWMEKLVAGLTDEQLQEMLYSEHGGLNETFADVASITNKDNYLDLARRFCHTEVLEPLLNKKDVLTGMHANTQIPKILGFKRVADLEKNEAWQEACLFFWETVTQHRSVCIGGNSVHEHFNPIDDFLRMVSTEQGPETCNTYNMLRLTRMLNATNPDGRYIDYYERALYNHILSTQHPQTGGFVYFTPMRPAHYRVYSQPQTSMWCCVGSGIENHSKYGEMIYAHTKEDLYVNLFIPSKLHWNEKEVEVIQSNHFPEEGATNLLINPKSPTTFELKIRYPQWANSISVSINQKPQPIHKDANGYITLKRKWKKGDQVNVQLAMSLQAEAFPDQSNFRSILYGPIVLASKCGTHEMTGLFADDSRGGHIAHGPKIPFEEIPLVSADDSSLLAEIFPIEGNPLHFKMQTSLGEVELEPFYQIHESRYTIYWPTSPIQNPLEALNEATVDMVYCGQQQPESDHFINFEESTTGYTYEKHWRKSDKWFSYEMNNKELSGNFLRISYLDTAEKAQAAILVNDQPVKNISSGKNSKQEISTLIHLTEKQISDKLTIKIVANKNLPTPQVTEIRILSKTVINE